MNLERTGHWLIWGAAVVAIVAIGVFAGRDRQLAWVPIAMVLLVFAAAFVQLLIAKSDGFIHRMSVSLTGAAVILALGSLVFFLLGAEGFVLV